MKTNQFAAMLAAMAENWTRRAYEKVAENFGDDVFYSDSLHYRLTNRRDLLAFFRDDGGHSQSCVFHRAVFDEAEQTGAAEYTYEGTHRYHGTVWIKIENDLIVEWREYQQTSPLDWEDYWKR